VHFPPMVALYSLQSCLQARTSASKRLRSTSTSRTAWSAVISVGSISFFRKKMSRCLGTLTSCSAHATLVSARSHRGNFDHKCRHGLQNVPAMADSKVVLPAPLVPIKPANMGVRHRSLASTCLFPTTWSRLKILKRTVTATVVELEVGILKQNHAVERQGKAADFDIAALLV